MELTKSVRKQMQDIIQCGILRRCDQWIQEMKDLLESSIPESENAFDRCMEVTKRSHNFFKEAMQRENYYRNTRLLDGAAELLHSGFLTMEDLAPLPEEVQSAIRFMARID